MASIAVILFPGQNCENETKYAVDSVGMKGDIIRWNSQKDLGKYDGYIIPGGWSYEDRIRAGVISAKDPVMNIIKNEALKGKPVLGICNGAQVLIEAGMIPGLKDEVEMALAPNINPFVKGFYCAWVNLKVSANKNCAFTKLFSEGGIVPMPIAHAEGRFTTADKTLLDKLIKNNQVAFRYCDKDGNTDNKFPINPNGSLYNIAALCNKEGNVMAIMPHPERASFNRQSIANDKTKYDMEMPLSARKIFESMKMFIDEFNFS